MFSLSQFKFNEKSLLFKISLFYLDIKNYLSSIPNVLNLLGLTFLLSKACLTSASTSIILHKYKFILIKTLIISPLSMALLLMHFDKRNINKATLLINMILGVFCCFSIFSKTNLNVSIFLYNMGMLGILVSQLGLNSFITTYSCFEIVKPIMLKMNCNTALFLNILMLGGLIYKLFLLIKDYNWKECMIIGSMHRAIGFIIGCFILISFPLSPFSFIKHNILRILLFSRVRSYINFIILALMSLMFYSNVNLFILEILETFFLVLLRKKSMKQNSSYALYTMIYLLVALIIGRASYY